MSLKSWEHFFKPEVRTSGQSLVSAGKVSVSQPSDIEISIFIRATPGFKVSFKTPSVENKTVFVDCNCPLSKKGQFCKHIWAGLLATEEKNSDFYESKTEIEKRDSSEEPVVKAAPRPQAKEKSAAFEAKQAEFKEKQSLYRKIQYQKQKLRQKAYKESKKSSKFEKPKFSADVEKALSFFSENGFELRDSLNRESIGVAKKKLARIFHPDIGGHHEEIIELNKYAAVLEGFVSQQQQQS